MVGMCKVFHLEKSDKFLITGTLVNGKPFRMILSNWAHANAINLYRGRVWLVRENGQRRLVKRVWN